MISPTKRKRGESGNSLFLGTMALIYIIPLMGLSIDASFLYAVKGRLQAAVDGAALGAARALNLGATLQSQQTNAAQNAVNWFYANFPPNTWATTGTVMSSGTATNGSSGFFSQNVNIYPDASNPQLDHVDITASTKVPTWFMHWFGLTSTTLNVKSSATRRAAVVMIVLDRSGSMCAVNGVSKTQPCTKASAGSACQAMINAAKQFTGQFAEGRDYIGLITFSTNTYVVKNSGGSTGVPDQNFQATLGYTNTFGSGTGALDSISCEGGTNTAQGIAQGYALLQQAQLPGALNIMLIETDGLPNSLTLNFYDSVNNKVALAGGSNCTDLHTPTPLKVGGGGFNLASYIPHWNTIGLNLAAAPFGSTSTTYPTSSTPAGMVGVVYSADPPGNTFTLMYNQWNNPSGPQATEKTTGTGSYNTNAPIASAPGCQFNNTTTSSTSDFSWWPTTDVYGDQLAPSSNAYKTVTTSSYNGYTRVANNGWTNFHNAAINAVDNAGYQARSNTNYPAYIFALGLGGNSAGAPPDPILMQRLANDPNGDEFNSPAQYSACSLEPTCVNYPDPQLQGTFVYAPDSDSLAQAFLRISSQILRLNK